MQFAFNEILETSTSRDLAHLNVPCLEIYFFKSLKDFFPTFENISDVFTESLILENKRRRKRRFAIVTRLKTRESTDWIVLDNKTKQKTYFLCDDLHVTGIILPLSYKNKNKKKKKINKQQQQQQEKN